MTNDGFFKQFAARRGWLVAALSSVVSGASCAATSTATSAEQPEAEAWIDLSEPVAAGAADPAEAALRAGRVAAQQDLVADRLRALGIVEVARVRHARNAILVRASSVQWPVLRKIPGVVRVRPVDTLHPPKPMP